MVSNELTKSDLDDSKKAKKPKPRAKMKRVKVKTASL